MFNSGGSRILHRGADPQAPGHNSAKFSEKTTSTRVHSSRMRTARSLPYRGISLTETPLDRQPPGAFQTDNPPPRKQKNRMTHRCRSPLEMAYFIHHRLLAFPAVGMFRYFELGTLSSTSAVVSSFRLTLYMYYRPEHLVVTLTT